MRGRWLAVALVCPAVLAAQGSAPRVVGTARVSWADAEATVAGWGELRAHFQGGTRGLSDVLTAMAVLEPGQEIHPPHRHAEEEFLLVTEGSGRWHLDGKEVPAARGDAIYAAPWVEHGITNTGKVPLTFVVWKYAPRGVPAPPAP